jgi:hypothetical protein
MIGLAGLALGATAPKANATIGPEITTTIYQDIDQDLTKDGFQIKYEWSVLNISPPANNWSEDAIWNYAIDANLETRGMYNIQNKDNPEGWDFNSGNQNYFRVNANGDAIYPGNYMTFSALIDKDLVIENESVSSTATANSGSYSSNITVPIPEPLTVGLLASGAGVLLAGRRVINNAKRR